MTIGKINNNKNYKLIIGRHCPFEKPRYLIGAVKEAVNYDANALMIYLGAPQNARSRVALTELKIPEFKQTLIKNKIDINNVIVHGPYILNMANADVNRKDAFF